MSIFKGSGVALVTPFNQNGIEFGVLNDLIDFHLDNSTDAIIVSGTTGEAPTLTDDERIKLFEKTVIKTNGRIPVIAGTGCNNTKKAIETSLKAQDVGVDALLVVTPYYNKTSQAGLIKHYEMIADAVDIPVMIYNVPSRTSLNVLPETLAALSDHENIDSVKEASMNIAQVLEIKRLCGDKLDIYSGSDEIVLPLLASGGVGVITTVGNIAPKAMHDVVDLFFKGDLLGSLNMQLKLRPLINAIFTDVNPMPIKKAVSLMGFAVGDVRPPLFEISQELEAALKNAMRDFGLIK